MAEEAADDVLRFDDVRRVAEAICERADDRFAPVETDIHAAAGNVDRRRSASGIP
jgi:hypothetical protein